jgi:hypothetical protein
MTFDKENRKLPIFIFSALIILVRLKAVRSGYHFFS